MNFCRIPLRLTQRRSCDFVFISWLGNPELSQFFFRAPNRMTRLGIPGISRGGFPRALTPKQLYARARVILLARLRLFPRPLLAGFQSALASPEVPSCGSQARVPSLVGCARQSCQAERRFRAFLENVFFNPPPTVGAGWNLDGPSLVVILIHGRDTAAIRCRVR